MTGPLPVLCEYLATYPGYHGRAHKGHGRCVRAQKRAQALRRGDVEPIVSAPLPAAAPPAGGCPWPWKDAHPDKAAASGQLRKLRREGDAAWATAVAYRCPAADHWHIGHPAVPAGPSRREREERERYAA